MVLEVGGRSEVLDASGVLFLFPMMLLAIVGFVEARPTSYLTRSDDS